MPPQQRQPSAMTRNEGVPSAGSEGSFYTLQKFQGINTKSGRSAIEDQEFSWLENLMPIGDGNLRAMNSNGAVLHTAATGLTIPYFFPYNIGANNYLAEFYSNGTANQIDTSNSAVTVITTATGTFVSSGNNPFAVQWADNGILIVSLSQANGYWAWDGTTLFSPGGPAPTWLSGLLVPIALTGNTNGTTTIGGLSSPPTPAGVLVGMSISGTGIPLNSTVVTISTAGTAITISLTATTTATGVTLSFTDSMPLGIQGTALEIYQDRVWIVNGETVTYSAPANGTDFSGADGGGAFKSTDSFLRHQYTIPRQANGYLYLFGDSSVNSISNVQTGGSPIATTFNNQNIDPQVGTAWPGTVHAFGRALLFANPSGVYAIYGGTAEKVSPQLDGLFDLADFVTFIPTASVATAHGVRIYSLLILAVDYLGQYRHFMCNWDGKKWFIATQDKALAFIESQEVNSVMNTWGTDGTSTFELFQTPSVTLTKTFQTKLWGSDNFTVVKQIMRFFIQVQQYGAVGVTFQGYLDLINEEGTAPIPLQITVNSAVIWINALGQVVSWTGYGGGTVIWLGSGLEISGQNIDGSGALVGLTLQSSDADFTLVQTGLLYHKQAPIGG